MDPACDNLLLEVFCNLVTVTRISFVPLSYLSVLSFHELSRSYSDCFLILLQEEHGHNQKAQLLLTVQQWLPGALMGTILLLRLLEFLLVHLLPRQLHLVLDKFYTNSACLKYAQVLFWAIGNLSDATFVL